MFVVMLMAKLFFTIAEPLCDLFGIKITKALALKFIVQLAILRDLDLVEFKNDN